MPESSPETRCRSSWIGNGTETSVAISLEVSFLATHTFRQRLETVAEGSGNDLNTPRLIANQTGAGASLLTRSCPSANPEQPPADAVHSLEARLGDEHQLADLHSGSLIGGDHVR